jgi:uncharacterized membrane protein
MMAGPTATPSGEDCGGSFRFWWIPAAFLGAFLAAAVGFIVLVWAGILPPPPWGGAAAPGWFLFPLGFLAFWLVVLLVVRPWHWRGGWGRGYGGYRVADAREIVRVRYARGEISREEMSGMLRDLDAHAGANPALHSTGDS